MRTSTFTVDDIHCGGCEQMIRTLVGDVTGVEQVDPDHRTNQVVVTYNESQVDDTAIREALANTGFRPQ
jgi:copper chaperone CopZ